MPSLVLSLWLWWLTLPHCDSLTRIFQGTVAKVTRWPSSNGVIALGSHSGFSLGYGCSRLSGSYLRSFEVTGAALYLSWQRLTRRMRFLLAFRCMDYSWATSFCWLSD